MPVTELRSAFPASLAEPVGRVLARLGPPDALPPAGTIAVVVEGEALRIPFRIYFDPGCLDGAQAMPEPERAVLLALFTRHHDGRVREACLREIIGRSEPWVAPFVVQLAGEYVIEIIEVIRSNLGVLDRVTYKRFVEANPAFVELTRQRIISYWNCYFRRQFPHRAGYPGFDVLEYLTNL